MKTVFITGANRGLGLELVKVFLKNSWKVFAACRNKNNFPAEISGSQNLTVLTLDIINQDSVNAALREFGVTPVDVLINNAGIFDSTSVDDDKVASTVEAAGKVFETNSVAPRLLAERLVPNLRAGTGKMILTISSHMGTHSKMDEYHAQHWVYSASKAAVNYAMSAFGLLHPDLKSVLIHPGWMKTDMGSSSAPLEPEFSAQKIFILVSTPKDMPNRKLVDLEGKEMPL